MAEFEIIEIAENICNLKKQEADWILQVDIVENADSLKVVFVLILYSGFIWFDC